MGTTAGEDQTDLPDPAIIGLSINGKYRRNDL